MIPGIRHNDVSLIINRDTIGPSELSVLGSLTPQELSKIVTGERKSLLFKMKNTCALQKLDFITSNLWLLKSVTMA